MNDDAASARYRRACDYLAVAMIYLRDNVLLDEPLAPEHLKPRVLGHWGTCPGLTLVYAGLNGLVRRTGQRTLLVPVLTVNPGSSSLRLQPGAVADRARRAQRRRGLRRALHPFRAARALGGPLGRHPTPGTWWPRPPPVTPRPSWSWPA